tara:strand:+ start:369 stop:482 length:114 start_codon:yes stop_codon:yes gene_type:complete
MFNPVDFFLLPLRSLQYKEGKEKVIGAEIRDRGFSSS